MSGASLAPTGFQKGRSVGCFSSMSAQPQKLENIYSLITVPFKMGNANNDKHIQHEGPNHPVIPSGGLWGSSRFQDPIVEHLVILILTFWAPFVRCWVLVWRLLDFGRVDQLDVP